MKNTLFWSSKTPDEKVVIVFTHGAHLPVCLSVRPKKKKNRLLTGPCESLSSPDYISSNVQPYFPTKPCNSFIYRMLIHSADPQFTIVIIVFTRVVYQYVRTSVSTCQNIAKQLPSKNSDRSWAELWVWSSGSIDDTCLVYSCIQPCLSFTGCLLFSFLETSGRQRSSGFVSQYFPNWQNRFTDHLEFVRRGRRNKSGQNWKWCGKRINVRLVLWILYWSTRPTHNPGQITVFTRIVRTYRKQNNFQMSIEIRLVLSLLYCNIIFKIVLSIQLTMHKQQRSFVFSLRTRYSLIYKSSWKRNWVLVAEYSLLYAKLQTCFMTKSEMISPTGTYFDPRGRPAAMAGSENCFRTCCPSVRTQFSKSKKTKQISSEDNVHYWRDCGSGRADQWCHLSCLL